MGFPAAALLCQGAVRLCPVDHGQAAVDLVEGVVMRQPDAHEAAAPVSYTHLDVYKRQGSPRPQSTCAHPTTVVPSLVTCSLFGIADANTSH